MCTCKKGKIRKKLVDLSNANWMEKNREFIKDKPMNCIIVPGTHDSGTYQLDLKHSIGSRSLKFASFMSRGLPCVKKIVGAWTMTQDLTIYEQLILGIRQFDFRLSYRKKNDSYYITHTFTCDSLNNVLDDVLRFCKKYKKEVISLEFTKDWEHRDILTDDKMKIAFNIAKNKLGKLLIKKDTKYPRYNNLINGRGRILLYFDRVNDDNVWNVENINNPWINTSTLEIKYNFLLENYKNMVKGDNKLNCISFTLTPQTKDVKDDVKNRILKSCCYKGRSTKMLTKQIQKKLDDFINNNNLSKLSSIVTDFPNKQFVDKVIKLNINDQNNTTTRMVNNI